MSTEIKPCPFACNGLTAEIEPQFVDNGFMHPTYNSCRVVCAECGAKGAEARTEHEAIELWNGRREGTAYYWNSVG